jgi:hypothetical protein
MKLNVSIRVGRFRYVSVQTPETVPSKVAHQSVGFGRVYSEISVASLGCHAVPAWFRRFVGSNRVHFVGPRSVCVYAPLFQRALRPRLDYLSRFSIVIHVSSVEYATGKVCHAVAVEVWVVLCSRQFWPSNFCGFRRFAVDFQNLPRPSYFNLQVSMKCISRWRCFGDISARLGSILPWLSLVSLFSRFFLPLHQYMEAVTLFQTLRIAYRAR